MRERFTKTEIRADERPKAVYDYIVTGRGEFPVDMLRYDGAWPANGEAADKLREHHSSQATGHRSVKLRSYREPTIGRWSSFGWSVGFDCRGRGGRSWGSGVGFWVGHVVVLLRSSDAPRGSTELAEVKRGR